MLFDKKTIMIDGLCSDWMAGLKTAEMMYKDYGMTEPYLRHWFHFNCFFGLKGYSFDFSIGFLSYVSYLSKNKELIDNAL